MSFRLTVPLILSLLSPLLAVSAQGTQCNSTSLCPESAPCCSEFGFCGTGSFCLGGCNPLASTTVTSCLPEPVCENANHIFTDTSKVLTNATLYDGNATAYDWVVDKGDIQVDNGELAMILTEDNGGTRLSSTRFVHYGKISANISTGKWGGVVTAFILMSNVKDEVDWEWPGEKTDQAQSNYFWQGVIPDKTAGATHDGLSDTSSNYHVYAFDWQQDSLTWLIDDKPVRTVKASDTKGSDGVQRFPSTPSRVQLSIWPAGINTSSQGTIDWAGGMIRWDDPDYKAAGHFWATVSSVSIACADASSNPADAESYVYGSNTTAFTPSVAVSNETTVNGALAFRTGLVGVGGVWATLVAGVAMALGAFVL